MTLPPSSTSSPRPRTCIQRSKSNELPTAHDQTKKNKIAIITLFNINQFHFISWMSVLVNFIPHEGHFRFREFWVSSMHFRQNKWGQVFSPTSLSLSPEQIMHMILLL